MKELWDISLPSNHNNISWYFDNLLKQSWLKIVNLVIDSVTIKLQ